MVKPAFWKMFYGRIEDALRKSGVIPGKSKRHMIFPYTLSAKIAQFPCFYYMKENWVFMYYPPAFVMSLWVFAKIHNIVNDEEYVRNWYQTQMEAEAKEHGHDH